MFIKSDNNNNTLVNLDQIKLIRLEDNCILAFLSTYMSDKCGQYRNVKLPIGIYESKETALTAYRQLVDDISRGNGHSAVISVLTEEEAEPLTAVEKRGRTCHEDFLRQINQEAEK